MKEQYAIPVIVCLLAVMLTVALVMLKWVYAANSFGQGFLRLLLGLIGLGIVGYLFFMVAVVLIFTR